MSEVILEMRGITKRFPGVKALDDVRLNVRAGEIHALVGENGAGKSTLMKILSGVYPHGTYEGELYYQGEPVAFSSIRDSEAKGIIIIHQELALVPVLSIAENVFLGNEQARYGVINWPDTYRRTEQLMKTVGLQENPMTPVAGIGVGKQQLVEIVKALSRNVKLLILDEPTSSLQENDSQKLLDLLLELKAQGITSILISHKLNEVRRVADSITILRDGQSITALDASTEDISEDRIVRDMVGRDMTQRFPDRVPNIGTTLLEVKNWNVWHPRRSEQQMVRDVNLSIAAGEVVGIAGLMGAGRTEFAMSLFGQSYGQNISGSARIKGREVDVSTVDKAIRNGIAYVTEDRKALGLILDQSLSFNTTLANLNGVASWSMLDPGQERAVAEDYRRSLNIRTPTVEQIVGNLSGGNQQKVMLARWLYAQPEVLILDEPTRGIDVGAKFEIYNIINELADAGRGVLMISSEMPELLGMCDRIYVMNQGEFIGELGRKEASQEAIMSMIVNS
ncbi:sugar ABC transporter ATP-binding protein [Natronospirillum operosum]|uniref:Sugar ABC transporter ATP-binding protein n=1 Tax=Natronospirillum operosum TaxID=2759953 RepID=A0A4Z0WG56_9GAMM|nr:multiple monosaccharide ABC transporter ATP-binding protein [Natronospirillum operosum]TGG93470.1 sugar ABC transporter ATP-binding protein [Natronospirillum operosum]